MVPQAVPVAKEMTAASRKTRTGSQCGASTPVTMPTT